MGHYHCKNTKPPMTYLKVICVCATFLIFACLALAGEPHEPEALPTDENIYVIERDIPGLGDMTPAQLKIISKKLCEVLVDLGSQARWLHSYVIGDKMYFIFLAPNVDIIREHANQGGFPESAMAHMTTVISSEEGS
jgi:hypothetical protein